MRQINDQKYTNFNSTERLNLTIAALARKDFIEADKLWQTCPKLHYRLPDAKYAGNFEILMLLNSMLFIKCIKHYNKIKKIDEYLLNAREELDKDQILKLDVILSKPKKIQTEYLKGLFEGYKMFCNEASIDYENAIEINEFKICCHDLEMLLQTDIKPNMEYAHKIKDIFLEYWR